MILRESHQAGISEVVQCTGTTLRGPVMTSTSCDPVSTHCEHVCDKAWYVKPHLQRGPA